MADAKIAVVNDLRCDTPYFIMKIRGVQKHFPAWIFLSLWPVAIIRVMLDHINCNLLPQLLDGRTQLVTPVIELC
jgi:hypothetical protein